MDDAGCLLLVGLLALYGGLEKLCRQGIADTVTGAVIVVLVAVWWLRKQRQQEDDDE